MRDAEAINLPRLLYFGDVPVEATYHGSVLLYRLLQSYPTESLVVLESDLGRSSPERRLPHINYGRYPVFAAPLLRTRFSRGYSALLWMRAQRVLPQKSCRV